MEKIQRSGHVRKNVNRIVSLICSAAMLMSTVQLSMPTAVYAEAATEAPVSQENQPAVQTETQPAAQAETKTAAQAETQPAVQAETKTAAQAETQSAVQPAAAQPAAPAAAQPAAPASTQPESQAAPQKEEQAVTSGSSESAPKSEAQTSSSSDKDNKEPETAYEVSEAAKKFVSDVSGVNWDSIKALRKTQFEADAALVHHPEDSGLKNAASNADQAMKQSRDSLAALQRAYSALPEEDRADQSVKEADQKLETIVTNLSNYEKSYFTDKVNALDSAEVLRISQAAVNAKAALDANEDEAKKEELEKTFNDADYAHKQSQADLDSLLNVYNQFSDEQKADAKVAAAYAALTSLNSQAAAITEPEASESPAETETEETEKDEPDTDAAAPAAASVKLVGPRRAPVANANETSIPITGTITGQDALAKAILFSAVNDTDFFQFQVTVTKENGTTHSYATSLSSEDCHASVDFDYNFTITGIHLDDTDKVTVKCVPDSSISSYSFTSTESPVTLTEDKGQVNMPLTLSIAEGSVQIHDVVIGDAGATHYTGSWSVADKQGHTYGSNISFWGNGNLKLPQGAAFTVNASRDGYILSTLSTDSIKCNDNNSSAGSVSGIMQNENSGTMQNENPVYDFVWVKKATDEESTFTKTWLDDGTDTSTHEKTPSLVALQYKVDGDDGEWKDVSEADLHVPSGTITHTSEANANKSIYMLNYSGLPEYMAVAVKNSDGTSYTQKKISYRLEEKEVPSGYSKESDGPNLVNTKEYTLNATIRWQDSEDAEGVRAGELSPDNIKSLIHVYNGETKKEVSVDPGNIQVTDQKDGTYAISIHGLPSYNGTMDNPNTYYIKKFDIPDKTAADGKNLHYTTQISNKSGVHENSEDAWNGATITCTISKTIDFSATKVWDDLYPSLRPKTQLELYRYTTNPQNMELVSVMETPDNRKKGETDQLNYKDLDAYDKNGRQYQYVVKETIPASDNGNYQAIYYKDADRKEVTNLGCPNGGIVLNKNVKNTTSIYVQKHWVAKGTTLKVAGYTVHVGLKRYTDDPSKAEIVMGKTGSPLVQEIKGFADYNDLTSGTTFSDLPMIDEKGNFYTYVPYEVPEPNYILTGVEDGTLDQGDAFTVNANGEIDTYSITNVTSADCKEETKRTRVTEITNTLGGTIRFVLSKKWLAKPRKTSVQYAIHRVDPYGKEEVLDNDGETWVALDKAKANGTYTGKLAGKKDELDWGSIEPSIVLPLYDEKSSRYTYFVDEVNDPSRHYFDYTLSQDKDKKADLVESVAITNDNSNGGDGQNMDVDLYKTWVDGGDTSTRQPVVIKVFRKDKNGKIDRPADWDKQNIGVYTLSADNGWHVTQLFGLSNEQMTTYFGSEENGERTLTDENRETRTFDKLLKNDIVYREVKVGGTEILAGKKCAYDSYTTTLNSENGVEVQQDYKVSYAGDNGSEVKNVKQGKVIYQINAKWFDGHYLKGRPEVTFNLTRDGSPYATCTVTVDKDGKVSTTATIDGNAANLGTDYSFARGKGESLNDYIITFNDFPLYNEELGTRYEYKCDEILTDSGYIINSPIDVGYTGTTTGPAGEKNENLKITTNFTNRREDKDETISYKKIWADHNNSENIRPDVTLNLAARVKSASQIKAAGGDEENLPLIAISCDTYKEAVKGQENTTYIYTFAQSMPKYVTEDLVRASNNKLTDDDIGAEVTYYASETMTGDDAKSYKETDKPADGTTPVQSGGKTYLANGSVFTNTMFGTMEASGTKVFSNVPYDMESDPLVMPQNGSIIFTLTQNGQPYKVGKKQATAELEVNGRSFTFAFKDQDGKTLKLPKYDGKGDPYTYSVTESFPDDAATSFGQVFEMTHVSRDLQVTNKYIAEQRKITVTKTFDTDGWTDAEKEAGRYPDVAFTLYRVKPDAEFNEKDSSQKLRTTTISGTQFKAGKGSATITFDNLYDLTPSGQRFAYYVVEKPINGYTVSCSVNPGEWKQTNIASMQSDDGSKIYDEVSFKNDYQKDNLITISANKKWGPAGILSSLKDIQNSALTFSLDGLANNDSNNAGSVKYTQGTDFTVRWDNAQGDSVFTIMEKDGKNPLKLRRYTSLGEAYVYRITENTKTDVWNAGGKLENFNCVNNGHFVQNWAFNASKDNQLNLGTIQNDYGNTSLVVTKQWDDNSNKNDMRPRSITVKLQYRTDGSTWTDVNADFLHRTTYEVSCDTSRGSFSADGFSVTYKLTDGVKDQNRAWTNCLTFHNLPLYENGKAYQYRAVETAIGGTPVVDNVAASYRYDETSSTNNYDKGGNVTRSTLRNKLIPASVSVTKTWADDSDKFLARPESLTLYLQRKVGKGNWEYVRHSSDNSLYTVVISSADNWSYAEQDTLPRENTKFDKYTYRFTEKAEGAAGTENDDSVNDVYSVNDVTVAAQNGNISYTGSEKTTDTGLNATKTDITNTLDTTSLTVEKKWASEDGKTPVTFQIQYQDKTTGSSWTAFKGVTLTLNEANTWKASLTNLPKRGKDGSVRYYRAVELDKNGDTVNFTDNGTTIQPTDGARDFDLDTGMFRAVYELTHNEDGTTTETVTNIKRTTVNVTKTFQDGANREVYRPASLTIACVSDNEDANKHTRTGNVTATASTKTVSSTTDLYTYSFIVDQYDRDGKKLDYKITETFSGNNQEQYQETDVLSKSADTEATVLLHTDTVDTQEADTAAVTNQHDISVFDLKLEKKWNDFGNFYKERPDQITVTLQYSTDGTHWNAVKGSASVENKDYTKAYAADVTAGYSTDGAEKTLKVDADGSVNAADATWRNLPVYARVGGQRVALQYRVLESKVTDYNNDGTKATSAVTGTDEKGAVKNSTVSLENTLNTTSVTVTKKWVDDNNFNGQRQNIEVQLYQNGTAIKDDVLYQEKALIELKTSGTTAETSAYTFQNLPRQDAQGRNYTYTVDEVNVPSGYTKSVSGTSITNRLTPVTASVSVTKDFGQNDWAKKAPKGFSFTLTRGSNDTQKVTTPMPVGTNGNTTTVTINKDTENLSAAFAAISYDHIGEYHYTLTENNGGVDGVAYDWDDSNNKQRTHSIVVTVSKNSNNTLAASVKYDGQNSLTVKNTFHETSASINVTKKFNDWSKTQKGFTFTLTAGTNTAGIATPMPEDAIDGVVSKTATATQHTVDFGSISYEKTGTYTYTVQETAGDEDGISYDATPYKVEVVVTKATDASNKLSAAVKYYGDKELTGGLTVTNTFTPVKGELKVRKEFNDWSKAGSFTFNLTPVDNAPMPADAAEGKKSVTVTNGSAAGFGSMTFEKVGTYTYHIREEKGTASGVHYDTQEHTAVVKVEKGTANKLSVTEIIYDGKKADNLTDPLVITNKFTSVQASVEVTKAFNGWTHAAYGNYFANTKFTFNISAVTADAPLPTENGKNVLTAEASKTVPRATFKPITFVKEGTYTYNITERDDKKDGIRYDGNTHTVTIVVSKDNDNKLTVSSIKYDDTNNSAINDDTHNSLTITNTYTPAVTADPIQVTKNFSDWTRTEKGFTFTLTAKDNNAGNGEDGQAIATPMPAGANGTSMTASATSIEKPTAVFGTITYRKAGIYHYTLTEANGEEDGITYDTADGDSTKAKEHKVLVTVMKDSTTNALKAEVTYDGQSSLTITNAVDSEKAHIQVKKDFNDWNNSANEFTFTLKAGNYCKPGETEPSDKVTVPMPEGAEDGSVSGKATSAAPNVDFGAITYKKAGTYHYTITETNDGRDGVSYDTTEHTVTVTVSKASDRTNKLSASVKYDGNKDSLTISNTFTAVKASIDLTKQFLNKETKENWPVDTSFTFDLNADSNTAGAEKNPMPEITAVTATKKQPQVSFGDITFSKAGTYYYTVTERNGQVDGVSYDADQHKVAVVVSKDSNNNALSANVYYDVTKNDKGTVPENASKSLTINNTYTPLKQTLKVKKSFNGWEDWNLFDDDRFTFTLTPVTADAPMPAGENGGKAVAVASKESPEAVFGEITYTKAGTYEYHITETNDHLDGVSYDTTSHNVLVSVSKSTDATNKLSAVVKYDGMDSLTITNTFTPVYQSLSVSKDFNDWTKAHSFTFNLAAKDHAPMPKDLKEATVSVRKDSTIDKTTGYPSAAFGQIEFDKAGTYEYTITEENGGADGVDYDTDNSKKPTQHEVKVTIAKDDVTNALSVSSVDSLTVRNTYTPATAHVEVTKDFNDWTKADSFTFDIAAAGNTAKDVDGNEVENPMPKNQDGKEVTSQSVDQNHLTAVFDEMTFEYAGVYTYKVTERNDHRDGVSYDVNPHIVTVTVTKSDDATNALSAAVTYEAADDSDIVPEDKSSLTIKNTFTPVSIAADDISKNFNGWTDSKKFGNFFDDVTFDIVLKPVTKDAPMPDGSDEEAVITATKKNPAPDFPEMTYVKAGTYEYTIQEVNGGVDGVDYDTDGTGKPTVHKVVVTVTKADDATNALSAAISYDGKDRLEIKNTFTPVDPPLHVTKSFNDWSKADSFTFNIKALTEGAPMPVNLTATATEAEKTAEFRNIEFWEVGKGTYEYEISEINDGIDGIAYDTNAHKAVIQVTKADDATNALSSAVLYDGVEAAKDDSTGLTITNTFTAATTVLKVTKDFNDWSKASGFRFDLTAKGDAPMPESKTGDVAEATKKNTTAAFGEIAFDKAGTYRYIITEENTGVDNVTYDTAKHKVEVTVVKDENTNALTVESVKYDGDSSLTIRNTYTAPAAGKSVKTGDTTPLNGWTAMLLAAMCLGFVAMEERKRQKKNHN